MKILHFDGYLAKDAEIKTTQKGATFLSFRVGNTTFIKGENKTDWIEVASFNNNDITAKGPYLKKGSRVFVIGTPDTTVNPGKDGRLYVNTSVLADRIEFISNGKKDKEGEGSETTEAAEPKINVSEGATDYSVVEKQMSQTVQATPAPGPAPAPAPSQASADDDDEELPF